MSLAYHPQTDGPMERTNHMLEDYLRTFVNYDKNDLYQILPLAVHVSNDVPTNAHKITTVFANYSVHRLTEWMKDREAQNPRAAL